MSDTGFGAAPEINLDDEDWFGDGSAFDSGEDLAAALMSFAGVSEATGGMDPSVPTFEVTPMAQSALAAMPRPQMTIPEFEVTELPATTAAPVSQAGAAKGWAARPAGERSQWGIRNSVKILKTTEDVIRRLREDAVEVAWRAAAVVSEQAPR